MKKGDGRFLISYNNGDNGATSPSHRMSPSREIGVEEIISDCPIDFIEIETAADSLKHSIQRYGAGL